jgi:hypothetical protein
MPRRSSPSKLPLAEPTAKAKADLERIERDAILHFEGHFEDLEKAVGMLRLAPHMGWRPIVLMHSKRTIAKYEEILGIKFKDMFDPEGPSFRRSVGYGFAKDLVNFWKAVSGDVSVPNRQKFSINPQKGT